MVYYSELRSLRSTNCLIYERSKQFWKENKDKIAKRILINQILSAWPSWHLRPKKKPVARPQYPWMEFLTCKCGWLLCNPYTLSCGHTICKICCERDQFCTKCGVSNGRQYIMNTTLAGLIERWYPKHYEVTNMKIKAKDFIAKSKYSDALEILNKALDSFPGDFIALNLRSQVYLALDEWKLGYTDAKRSCKINETCGESFFRLGEAFAALNRFDDAVQAFNTCLELEPEDGELNTKVCDSLDQLLTRSPGQEIEVSEDEEGESSKGNDSRGDGTDEGQNVASKGPPNRESTQINPCENVSPQELQFTCDNGKEIASSDGKKINLDLTNCDKEDEKYLLEEKQKIATGDNCRDLTGEKHCRIPPSPKADKPCSSSSIKRSHSLSPEPAKISRVVEKKAKIGKETTEPQLDDFECKLCFCILFHPVTTTCGHVFCRNCLETCIDYNPACPICRRNISFNETTGVGNVTEVIQKAIEHYFPDEIEERKNKHKEHMSLMARFVRFPSLLDTIGFKKG